MAEVMSLLGSAGFDLYLSDPTNLTAQVSAFTPPLLSPSADDEDPFDLQRTGHNSLDTDGGIIFTRSRSNTNGTTSSSGSRSFADPLQRMTSPTDDTSPDSTSTRVESNATSPVVETRVPSVRSVSHSPSGCDVRVLSPDITCVGLSDDSADVWGLKIVKLVAFPELIAGVASASAYFPERRSRRRTPSPVLSALPEEHIHVISLSEGENGSGSDTTTRVAPESPKKDPADRSGSESPTSDLERETTVGDAVAEGDLTDTEDDDEGERNGARPTLRNLDSIRTARPKKSSLRSRSVSQASSSSSVSEPEPLVPFFSFTRTTEGSSLAAPVSLLATLFPASERHMVMCSQELDVVDSRNASPERWAQEDEDDTEDGDTPGELPEPEGTLKCLQIDLRKFGLGEHFHGLYHVIGTVY